MAATLRRKVVEWAILSRLFLFALQAFANIFIPDHDANVFNTPLNEEDSVLDWLCSYVFGGLGCWDGQYFLHIAKYGYTYENSLVFFPLYPLVTKLLATTVFWPLQIFVSYHNTILISGVVVSAVSFVASVDILYQLSRHVLKDERLSYRVALLYCINPASVFFSAVYSESLFALCTFSGMLFMEKNQLWPSAVCFALGAATRANGMIACGFVVYRIGKQFFVYNTRYLHRQYITESSSLLFVALREVLTAAVSTLLILAPFTAHQLFAYKRFCWNDKYDLPDVVTHYAMQKGFRLPGKGFPEWCSKEVPISYSHIQTHFWNVGFLLYYQWRQTPNFALASPIIFLILSQVYKYFHTNRIFCMQLGLLDEVEMQKSNIGSAPQFGAFSTRCFVYVAHCFVLLIFGVFFINIQVITRLLCSSTPVVYWFAAEVMSSTTEAKPIPVDVKNHHTKYQELLACRIEDESNLNNIADNLVFNEIQQWNYPTWGAMAVSMYFLSYFMLGTVMFSNFYPFT